MTYLLLIFLSIALFAGFFGLTIAEARSGTRVLALQRTHLDKQVARVAFIIKHVDWVEFLSHAIQSFFERVIHDAAHLTLIVVRFIERNLTDVVRYLRDRRPNLLAPKPSRTPIHTQAWDYVKKTFFVRSERK
jgi:hypothetical protein